MIRKTCTVRLFILGSSILFLFGYTCFGQAWNIKNPVLPGVADAGVIRYNGEYYIGGVFTNGGFFKSRDLVQWDGPIHVFSMDNEWTMGPSADDSQIHANDINYINGVFHQYWSVNYWGDDQHVVHIGHATATDILGPYREPVKETWLENRIDPKLFIDDDGTPYLYMVKFTDGNTIWGRPMKDPGTFAAPPTYLFSSLPNTWETLDNRVAEGPWVIKYRNRYYMMYNANHTSTQWGNYSLGVAEADSPLGFNHGSKYPYPVVLSNQVELEDRFIDLLEYTGMKPDIFRYTTSPPEPRWSAVAFDASAWKEGKAGFGSVVVKNATAKEVRTLWKTEEIWLRKSFIANKGGNKFTLRIHHDGETTVFLNGESIYQHTGRQYTAWNFDDRAYALLRDGDNVLAIHSKRGQRGNYLDVSVFDMQDESADDILFSPGQPNILKGPNGFEWWLIYMANKNGESRGQYINRIHFFNKTLYADGVTASRSRGYHPVPSKPTFSDLFDTIGKRDKRASWNTISGSWHREDGEFVQERSQAAHALLKIQPATHYLFEAGVKLQPGTGAAGIYAWWQDENNFVKVVLDQEDKKWTCVVRSNGENETLSSLLPVDFRYDVYHSLRVYKNAADFTIEIDDRPAPGQYVITAPACSGKGRPGLHTQGGKASFDGVLFTIGFDEFDEMIKGWTSSGTEQKRSWSVTPEGLRQAEVMRESSIFKGDMLDAYEVAVQVSNASRKGASGMYPVYLDPDNYVKALIDFDNNQLIVSGQQDGKSLPISTVSLENMTSYYADMRYTDFIEKRFTFHSPTRISAISFDKRPHGRKDTLIHNIHNKVNIFYKHAEKWFPLEHWSEEPSTHPGFVRLSGAPVSAEALKVVNRDPADHAYYIYRIRVNQQVKESYNLRVAKHPDTAVFVVDGREVLRIKHSFPASRVGLVTENTTATFNGITVFHIPEPAP